MKQFMKKAWGVTKKVCKVLKELLYIVAGIITVYMFFIG